MINDAKDILSLAKTNDVSIPLPEDVVCDDSVKYLKQKYK